MIIQENIKQIRNFLTGNQCVLVAISKTKTSQDIMEAYHAGIRDFGENKVQEMVKKKEELPADIRWHMVGHLQRNKVKLIASFVHLIQSVDSLHLLEEINRQGEKYNRVIKCLLQVHIAEEETKFGFDEKEIFDLVYSPNIGDMEFISIRGLMGMATFTDDTSGIKREFASLKKIFDKIKTMNNPPKLEMEFLSMGMSGDYTSALEEGSNMLRIGTAIFGERNYHE
jgi:PLP dependent protein